MAKKLPLAALAGTLALVLLPTGAGAQSFQEALSNAYRTNPALAAERQGLRATNEVIAQALSAYRPSVSLDANIGTQITETDPAPPGGSQFINPSSIGISVNQPIYQAGREAGVSAAENQIQAARAAYLGTEQQVLFNAGVAYLDVVRDQAFLELARNNLSVLQRQLDAARAQFDVGELTRTDVSQAEARVAGAQAQIASAEGTLRSSRAAFERFTGLAPGALSQPDLNLPLPTSLQESVLLAETGSLQVIGALFNERAQRDQIAVREGELMPRFGITGSLRDNYNPGPNTDRSTSGQIRAEFSWPLYQAGAASSRIRQQRHSANEAAIQVDEQRRAAIEAAISAWEIRQAARATIESLRVQIRAAQVALEGVRAEMNEGFRTILDVLDAEQEVFQARTDLVSAERDELAAELQLLAATGRLTVQSLGLPVPTYAFGPDYERARNTWMDTDYELP